jgi:putative oxidoreductase
MNEYKLQIAEMLVRVFAGILFLFQGYDKLFRIKMPGVIATFSGDAQRYHIPMPIVTLISYYTSIAEFAGGLMLILGFFTQYALMALGLDLLLVCFAFTYMEPMWNMKYVFPRFLLVVFLLVIPAEHSKFTLDHYLQFH